MKRIIAITLVIVATAILARADEMKSEKTAKDYIADLSSGADENTLIDAAKWLGNKKEKDAVPGLINLLGDKREPVRTESAVALGLIGEESAVDALDGALLNDESPVVRYAALLATLRIGSKKSIDAYRQAKDKDTDPFIQDLLGKLEKKASSK